MEVGEVEGGLESIKTTLDTRRRKGSKERERIMPYDEVGI